MSKISWILNTLPVRGEAGAWNIDDSIINHAKKEVDFEHPTERGEAGAWSFDILMHKQKK